MKLTSINLIKLVTCVITLASCSGPEYILPEYESPINITKVKIKNNYFFTKELCDWKKNSEELDGSGGFYMTWIPIDEDKESWEHLLEISCKIKNPKDIIPMTGKRFRLLQNQEIERMLKQYEGKISTNHIHKVIEEDQNSGIFKNEIYMENEIILTSWTRYQVENKKVVYAIFFSKKESENFENQSLDRLKKISLEVFGQDEIESLKKNGVFAIHTQD